MASLGLPFTFFDAVDGRALSEAEIAALNPAARRRLFLHDLTRGEIGCFLSHSALYQEIVRDKTPLTAVLEDDAEVNPTFVRLMESIEPLPPFDLIWFCGGAKGKRYQLERRLLDEYILVRPFENKSTTQGYVVSLAGAAKLARHCAQMTDPIDVAIKRYWAFGGDVFNVLPAACKNLPDVGSTIEGRTTGGGLGGGARGMTALGALRHNRLARVDGI